MPSVQIKHVPEEVHAVLRRRAAAEGRSLQEHLLALLREEAETASVAEVLLRLEGRGRGDVPLDVAAAAVREDRDGR